MNELAIVLIVDGLLILFLVCWGYITERGKSWNTVTRAFEKWDREHNSGNTN